MNVNLQKLAMDATREALNVRARAGLNLSDPVPCIYDLINNLGVEIRFLDVASMEGMYSRDPLLIVVSSFRPAGRQAFTAAHELGHHLFNHGVRVDELVDQLTNDPKEYLVNQFAGSLFMPKTVVNAAFTVRGWRPQFATPIQIYSIANYLGVGYSTLCTQMAFSLNLLDKGHFRKVENVQPKAIRAQILNRSVDGDLIVVDSNWRSRPIDAKVGDLIHLSKTVATEKQGSSFCVQLLEETDDYILLRAVVPGIGRVYNRESDWAAFVRVSPRDYVGRSIFRHLEDPDE